MKGVGFESKRMVTTLGRFIGYLTVISETYQLRNISPVLVRAQSRVHAIVFAHRRRKKTEKAKKTLPLLLESGKWGRDNCFYFIIKQVDSKISLEVAN